MRGGRGGGRIHTGLERAKPVPSFLWWLPFRNGLGIGIKVDANLDGTSHNSTFLFSCSYQLKIIIIEVQRTVVLSVISKCFSGQGHVEYSTAMIHFFFKSQSLNFLSWRWLGTLWKVRLLSFLSSATQSGRYTALVITWCILKKVKLKKLLEDEKCKHFWFNVKQERWDKRTVHALIWKETRCHWIQKSKLPWVRWVRPVGLCHRLRSAFWKAWPYPAQGMFGGVLAITQRKRKIIQPNLVTFPANI